MCARVCVVVTRIRNPSQQEHIELDVRRRKALWRCKQRGWVEIDLLMGNWAAENIPKMSEEELLDLEVIIAQVTDRPTDPNPYRIVFECLFVCE